MIREANIYALRKLPDEERAEYGIRVLTMRRWPRGVRKIDVDLWVKDAAPSLELLIKWQTKQIDWTTFLACYQAEQKAQETTELVQYHGGERTKPRIIQVSPIAYLARLAQHQPVTVLCWEQKQCHRFILVKMIEQQLTKDEMLRAIRSRCSPLIQAHPEYELYTLYLVNHAEMGYIYSLLDHEWCYRNTYHNLQRAITDRDIWLKLANLASEGGFLAMALELHQQYERVCHLVMTYQRS